MVSIILFSNTILSPIPTAYRAFLSTVLGALLFYLVIPASFSKAAERYFLTLQAQLLRPFVESSLAPRPLQQSHVDLWTFDHPQQILTQLSSPQNLSQYTQVFIVFAGSDFSEAELKTLIPLLSDRYRLVTPHFFAAHPAQAKRLPSELLNSPYLFAGPSFRQRSNQIPFDLLPFAATAHQAEHPHVIQFFSPSFSDDTNQPFATIPYLSSPHFYRELPNHHHPDATLAVLTLRPHTPSVFDTEENIAVNTPFSDNLNNLQSGIPYGQWMAGIIDSASQHRLFPRNQAFDFGFFAVSTLAATFLVAALPLVGVLWLFLGMGILLFALSALSFLLPFFIPFHLIFLAGTISILLYSIFSAGTGDIFRYYSKLLTVRRQQALNQRIAYYLNSPLFGAMQHLKPTGEDAPSVAVSASIDELLRYQTLGKKIHQTTLTRSSSSKQSSILPLTHYVLNRFEHQIKAKNITVKTEGLEEVQANFPPDVFCEILDNLLSNAVKFTPPNSTVTIRWQQNRQKIWLRVEDEGSGVPEDQRPFLFLPFNKRAEHYQLSGDGIGLYLSKKIAQKNGGDLKYIPSEQGAVFELTLPADFKRTSLRRTTP